MISPPQGEHSTSTWTVVVSRGQSRNPAKRALEQAIADAAAELDHVNVVIVPHLYDLPKGGESLQTLAGLEGDLIVLSWIFPRAAHWVLDRNGIRGQFMALQEDSGDEEEEDADPQPAAERDVQRVSEMFPRPERDIHCGNLRDEAGVDTYVQRIRELVEGSGTESSPTDSLPIVGGKLVQVEESTSRRWYPVIDFNRCTNCMECIDFCLFGVYGVDGAETILVEQPDNCRKGCPACSRVCPENAIIFPQHKAPAIAGSDTGGSEGFKIDLSKLFGAPEGGDDAIATAARERDEQLLLAGRDAVGIDEQLQRRQSDLNAQPKDDLDALIDSLDELDL
ncbi:ferredoxin family protein [Roseiconus nitratireducens]|uniref:Ferredoxin family protein n=1 Tax=Roseiconus nitratireducens TaxID=2605748 RepID=A0A5M6CXZ1_9BACT|nr:ferredoxin family protein [Roseiconus nitratireducens]KAA5539280.1 ferredoxin family protein [Roseiconus nitratireducens]